VEMAQAHRQAVASGWLKSYKKAMELDSWGQREEAKESYDKLAEAMVGEMAEASSAQWSKRETKNVQSMIMCVRLRAKEIGKGGDESITLSNIRTLATVMENLFKADKKFPLDLSTLSEEDLAMGMKDMVVREREPQTVADEELQGDDEMPTTPVASGSFAGTSSHSSPAKTPVRSAVKGRQVVLTIDKMGFKDDKLRDSFVDPIITIYVVCRLSSLSLSLSLSCGTSLSACRATQCVRLSCAVLHEMLVLIGCLCPPLSSLLSPLLSLPLSLLLSLSGTQLVATSSELKRTRASPASAKTSTFFGRVRGQPLRCRRISSRSCQGAPSSLSSATTRSRRPRSASSAGVSLRGKTSRRAGTPWSCTRNQPTFVARDSRC